MRSAGRDPDRRKWVEKSVIPASGTKGSVKMHNYNTRHYSAGMIPPKFSTFPPHRNDVNRQRLGRAFEFLRAPH
jgi:hypothetical protein